MEGCDAEVGCPETSCWSSYFRNRKAIVCEGNLSVQVEVVRGCPQGSVDGPQFWNIMIDPLLQQLNQICKFSAEPN